LQEHERKRTESKETKGKIKRRKQGKREGKSRLRTVYTQVL
jgi:hypothetical protein